MDLLNNDPRSAISSQDLAISQKCEDLIMTEPTFQEIRGSVGNIMRTFAAQNRHCICLYPQVSSCCIGTCDILLRDGLYVR